MKRHQVEAHLSRYWWAYLWVILTTTWYILVQAGTL